jgi:hypothetical protein
MELLSSAWVWVAPLIPSIVTGVAVGGAYGIYAGSSAIFPFAPCSLVENHHGYLDAWRHTPHVVWLDTIGTHPADRLHNYKCARRDALRGYLAGAATNDELYTLKVWPSWIAFARERIFGTTWAACRGGTLTAYHVNMHKEDIMDTAPKEKVVLE